MNKTKIDWCDSTWNPVTGCLHGCEYYYARRIADRFGGTDSEVFKEEYRLYAKYELDKPLMLNGRKAPYPYEFVPTFHRYRLNDYIGKSSRNIFVCSMADLFGEWVPDSWIEEVFKACEKAPQHNYLFLTKNPKRYKELEKKGILQNAGNMWFGFTNTKTGEYGNTFLLPKNTKTFVSVKPLYGVPLFMKSSLADTWGGPLIQEFPGSLKKRQKHCAGCKRGLEEYIARRFGRVE